ncbi:MAG: FkbM family methyltransferase [Saprospiraceae bacterium]|nr:FkbM family methyltransferase [Saprospiraceae bacterium]
MSTPLHHLIRAARHKKWFLTTCQANGLSLDYAENEAGIGIFKEVFVQRVYADFFPFFENATVIDIGGHFGYFTLFAAVNLGREGRVITVEPSKQNFDLLCRNLAKSGLQNKVSAINVALAATPGEKKLFTGKSENHSLIAPGENAVWEVTQALTLDALVEKNVAGVVHFLKMDCEGTEYDILFGADRVILDQIQTISLEFHDLKSAEKNGLKLAQYLKTNGFNIARFNHNKTTMGNNYGNIIATKKL